MKNCTRCGEMKPLDDYYFVSKKTGQRRGQCKPCMKEIKALQRDPDWKPSCAQCGRERERVGPGRRLCQSCFDAVYDGEAPRKNGSHRRKLKPCQNCGAERLRGDHVSGTVLCPSCRAVPQGRRKTLQKYNLTPAEYEALLDAQGRVCAICKRRPSPRKSLSVDHRHAEPSIVRGAICARCNTVLGLMRDNEEALRNAADFLADPPAQQLFPGRVATPEANRSTKWSKNPRRQGAWKKRKSA